MLNNKPVVSIWVLILILVAVEGCGRSSGPTAQPLPTPPPRKDPMPFSSAPPPPLAPLPLLHRVQAGDTLMAIARWYTGAPNNWTALVRANTANDPRRMPVGTVVRIPDDLLIRRDPMPPRRPPAPGKIAPSPPAPAVHEAAPVASQETVPSPATENLELFGPIETPRQPAPLELEALP